LNRYLFFVFCMSLCSISFAQSVTKLPFPNEDSVLTSFLRSCDSMTFSRTNEFQSLRDSLMVKLNFLDLLKSLPKEMNGRLSATDEFGLLTTYVNPNSTSPMHVFRTEGDFNLPLLGLQLINLLKNLFFIQKLKKILIILMIQSYQEVSKLKMQVLNLELCGMTLKGREMKQEVW